MKKEKRKKGVARTTEPQEVQINNREKRILENGKTNKNSKSATTTREFSQQPRYTYAATKNTTNPLKVAKPSPTNL